MADDPTIDEDILGDLSFSQQDGRRMTPRISCALEGTVSRRDDPKGLGRIQARSEGLFEQGTDWLVPLAGGGIANRGKFDPPRIGAKVYFWFPIGRIGPGIYAAAGWERQAEVPEGAIVSGKYTRSVEEDDQWLIVRDDRSGNGEYIIKHKASGSYIKLGENGKITINANVEGLLQEGADQHLVLGEKLLNYFNALTGLIMKLNTHQHLGVQTGVGVSGPPSPVAAPTPSTFFVGPGLDTLSSYWKTKE